jgi:hypothetical protein
MGWLRSKRQLITLSAILMVPLAVALLVLQGRDKQRKGNWEPGKPPGPRVIVFPDDQSIGGLELRPWVSTAYQRFPPLVCV